jgi:hypothetical protein
MFEASIEPSAAPAPTTVWSSSIKTIWSSELSRISSMTFLRRSSNWPRYLRPGDYSREIERQNPLAAQGLGHLVVDYPLGYALDDGGLADAGIPDEDGVVLGPPGEDLDGRLYLVLAPDDRVQLSPPSPSR